MKVFIPTLLFALSLGGAEAVAQATTCSQQYAICANPASEASRAFRGDRASFCQNLKDTCMKTGNWQTGRANLTGLKKQ